MSTSPASSPGPAPAAAVSPDPGFTTAGRRRRARRYLAVTTCLVLLVAALWWATVLTGEHWYTPDQAVAVMLGRRVPGASFVIGELTLPRAILGLLAGLAFGMSGTTSQTMLRNQLASPDVIGITSGASAAAVFAILVLDWSGMRVNLIALGFGLASMLSSVIAYLQLKASVYDVVDAMRWLSGSLSGASWDQVPLLGGSVLVLSAVLLGLGRDLRVLPLGEEAAVGLGVPVQRTRLTLLLTMVALASFATAVTGPIAFVAFLAGPIAARLIGRTDRTLLVPAALTGAAIVLGGDLAGQHLSPTTLPVGVVTGIVGAPYLVLQLIRLNRQGASA